jgi:hypothetical protein
MNEQSNEKAPLLDPCGNIIDEAPAITGHFKSARQLEERVTSDEFSRAVNALGAAETDTAVGDPEFLRLLEEVEALEKVANFRSSLSAIVTEDMHIITSGGRVVPTHVVRGFSKPKAEFVPICEDYVKGFYPTLELTNGTEVQVGEFCHTLEESECVITVILNEVRRKAANY